VDEERWTVDGGRRRELRQYKTLNVLYNNFNNENIDGDGNGRTNGNSDEDAGYRQQANRQL
jgi:hypothetical protein